MHDVLEAPRVDFAEKLAPKLEPEHEWVGAINDIGRQDPFALALRLRLRIGGGLVDGTGVAWLDDGLFGEGGLGRTLSISVAGTVEDGQLSFSLWIEEPPLGDHPMSCHGALSLNEDRIEGGWSLPCISPDTCGCDGSSGGLTLSKEALD